jgi:hypothetical protein
MLGEDKQREIVRMRLVDKISERKISDYCNCHRKTVRKYVFLFINWLEEEKAIREKMSQLVPTGTNDYLTGIINNGDWVMQPLRVQIIGEMTEAITEISKARKNDKSIKVMEIYQWLKNQRRQRRYSGGLVLEEEKNLSYTTMYLAYKLEKEKK